MEEKTFQAAMIVEARDGETKMKIGEGEKRRRGVVRAKA